MTVPPPGPQASPTPAQLRYTKDMLARLSSVAHDPNALVWPSIDKIIFRLGELGVREAEPLILKLASASPQRSYCVCRALGQIGSPAAVSTVGKFYTDPASPPALRHIAGEALLRLTHEENRPAFRARLRDELPTPLGEAIKAGDAAAFGAVLRDYLAPKMDALLRVIDTLYLIDGPVVRPALLDFARTAPLTPPAFRRLRSLFKAAEYRRDGELFGILAHRFETTKAGVQYHSSYHAEAARRGQLAYGSRTRQYLRQRAWRTLRRLGLQRDPDFIRMAVGVLVAYTDSDANPPRAAYSHAWHRGEPSRVYPPFAPYHLLNKLLFLNDSQISWGRRLFVTWPASRPAQGPHYPGREAFGELWRERPAGLLHLLDESRCAPVHAFAAPALAACEDFCQGLDHEAIVMLLSRPYEATAALGFSLLKQRYKPASPDLDLLILLVSCAHAPARQLALEWVEKLGLRLLSETDLLVALISSPHGDVREQIRKLLGTRAPTEAQCEAIVTKTIAFLLTLGVGDTERIRGAAQTLRQRFHPQLTALHGPLLADLLQHPAAALQGLGSEILVFGRASVSDDLLFSLLKSPDPDVRAAGLLLLDQMLDSALPTRTELISRMLAHAEPELRAAARRLARRLARLGGDLERALGLRVVEAILRRKLPEGVAEELCRVLREDLPGALAVLDAATVWRLLSSGSPEAQGLGDVLLARRDLGAVLTVDQIGKLADQETLALREAAWAMFERHPAKMKTDLAGAVRVLDARWDDTRAFGFRFFREQFAPGELPVATLVAVCDSVRPDVQVFGREMLTKHARDEDGLELLWRLSEHPAMGVQLHVSEFLERHASGDPAKITALEAYFHAVLGRVNRGRTAKKRVLAFLRREGEASLGTAQVVLPILHRLSATSAVEYRAASLAAIVALQRAHPALESPVRTVPREARHGIQLYVPG